MKILHSSKSDQIVFGYNIGHVEIFINFFAFDILYDSSEIHTISEYLTVLFLFLKQISRKKTPSNRQIVSNSSKKVVSYFHVTFQLHLNFGI